MLSTLVVSASLLAINQGSEGCSEPSKISGIRLVADEDQEVLLDIDNGLYEYCRVLSLQTGELEFEEVSCTANVRAMESMPDYDVEVDVVSSHELFLAIEGVEIDLTLSGDTFIDADAFAYFYSPSMRSVFIFTAAENSTTQIDLVTVAFNVDKSDPLYAVQYDIENTGSIEDILNGELMRSFDESDLFMVQAGSFAECEGVSWLRYSFVAGLYDLLASRNETSTQIAFMEIGSGYIGVDSRLSSARAYGFDSHTVRYFEADGARLELFRTEEFEFESAELSSYWALMWLLIAIAISLCCCFCVCAGCRWRTRKSSASKGAASEAEQETQTTTDIEMQSGQHKKQRTAENTDDFVAMAVKDPLNQETNLDTVDDAQHISKPAETMDEVREADEQTEHAALTGYGDDSGVPRDDNDDNDEEEDGGAAVECDVSFEEDMEFDDGPNTSQIVGDAFETIALPLAPIPAMASLLETASLAVTDDMGDDGVIIGRDLDNEESDDDNQNAYTTDESGYGDDSGVPRDDNDEEYGGAAVERDVSFEEDMDFDIDDGPNTPQIAGDAFETERMRQEALRKDMEEAEQQREEQQKREEEAERQRQECEAEAERLRVMEAAKERLRVMEEQRKREELAPIPAMSSLLETASLAVTDDMGDGIIVGRDLDSEESDDDSQNAYTADESGEELKDGDDGDGKKKKRKRSRSGSRRHTRTVSRSTLVTGRVNEKEEKLRRWAGDKDISGGHANSERLRSKSKTERRKHAEVKAIDVAREDPSNVTVLHRRVSVVKHKK